MTTPNENQADRHPSGHLKGCPAGYSGDVLECACDYYELLGDLAENQAGKKQAHSKEPLWNFDDKIQEDGILFCCYIRAIGQPILRLHGNTEDELRKYAARIVAAMNFCRNVPTEELEDGVNHCSGDNDVGALRSMFAATDSRRDVIAAYRRTGDTQAGEA